MRGMVNVTHTRRRPDGVIEKRVTPDPSSVKVWKDEAPNGEEATFLRVPISSTTEDRDGDDFDQTGLKNQAQQLNNRVAFFFDHGLDETGFSNYRTLDMEGSWVKGEIEDNVLFGTLQGEPGSERVQRLAEKIEAGLPIGFSVGFKDRKSTDKDDGGRTFHDVDLMEVSAVGIPSNPDAVSHEVSVIAKKAGLTTDQLLDQLKNTISSTAEETTMGKNTDDEKTASGEEDPALVEQLSATLDEKFAELKEDLGEQVAEAVAEKAAPAIGESVGENMKTALEPLLKDDGEEEDEERDDDEKGAEKGEDEPEQKGTPQPQGISTLNPDAMPTQGQGQGQPQQAVAPAHQRSTEPLTPGMQKVGPFAGHKGGDDE